MVQNSCLNKSFFLTIKKKPKVNKKKFIDQRKCTVFIVSSCNDKSVLSSPTGSKEALGDWSRHDHSPQRKGQLSEMYIAPG